MAEVKQESKTNAELAWLVEEHLELPAQTTAKPVLILISGLPGTGKSHLSRRIAEKLPSVVVETDFVRKVLFPSPQYTAQESETVYGVCHELIGELLSKGWRVIFDGTNLYERKRELVVNIARRAGAKALVVKVTAPEELVRDRLERRTELVDPCDISDADYQVHQRFKTREEKMFHPHTVVDTSQSIDEQIMRVLRIVRKL